MAPLVLTDARARPCSPSQAVATFGTDSSIWPQGPPNPQVAARVDDSSRRGPRAGRSDNPDSRTLTLTLTLTQFPNAAVSLLHPTIVEHDSSDALSRRNQPLWKQPWHVRSVRMAAPYPDPDPTHIFTFI